MPCSPQLPQFRIAVDVSQANPIDDPSSPVMRLLAEGGPGTRPLCLSLDLGPDEFRLLADCLRESGHNIPVIVMTEDFPRPERLIPTDCHNFSVPLADLAAGLAQLNTKAWVRVQGLARG